MIFSITAPGELVIDVASESRRGALCLRLAAYGAGVPRDLETGFSLSGADELGTSGESSFTISETEPRTFVSIKQTSGSLRGETVTVTSLDDTPSAVPLPATALLMLTGFGGLSLLRRRAA